MCIVTKVYRTKRHPFLAYKQSTRKISKRSPRTCVDIEPIIELSRPCSTECTTPVQTSPKVVHYQLYYDHPDVYQSPIHPYLPPHQAKVPPQLKAEEQYKGPLANGGTAPPDLPHGLLGASKQIPNSTLHDQATRGLVKGARSSTYRNASIIPQLASKPHTPSSTLHPKRDPMSPQQEARIRAADS